MPTQLDIGGGTLPQPGHYNLDPVHGEGDWKRRIQDGLPFLEEGHLLGAYASHVFEHIPAGAERIAALNEIHRVLAPGAKLRIIVPLVGYTDAEGTGHLVEGWQAYADPTHVSSWWFPESLLYVCRDSLFTAHADYGIRLWDSLRPEDWEVRGGWEGHATLHKPLQED